MAWRLHLTNQAIQRLDILDGDPPLLAVWTRRDRVAYYHLETGAQYSEQRLKIPDSDQRDSDGRNGFSGRFSSSTG